MGLKEDVEKEMTASINHFIEEIKNIRTGRASPGMLDQVTVLAYGTQMRIKELASITTPEPRALLITPFDPTTTSAIGKAIEKANLGVVPIVEANLIRINIPSMDANVRKDMIKLLHKRCEDAKIVIRQIRAKYNKHVQKEKADGNIGEDLVNIHEKEVQKLTDLYCKKTDDLAKVKEQEISSI